MRKSHSLKVRSTGLRKIERVTPHILQESGDLELLR